MTKQELATAYAHFEPLMDAITAPDAVKACLALCKAMDAELEVVTHLRKQITKAITPELQSALEGKSWAQAAELVEDPKLKALFSSMDAELDTLATLPAHIPYDLLAHATPSVATIRACGKLVEV